MEVSSNSTSMPFNTYGIKRKPTSVKNLQATTKLECIHAVFINMLRTA